MSSWVTTAQWNFCIKKKIKKSFSSILHKNQVSSILDLNVRAITIFPKDNKGEYFYEVMVGSDLNKMQKALIVKAKTGD